MKYCPYCGDDFADSTASFCTECGKNLPKHEDLQKKRKGKSAKEKKVCFKTKAMSPNEDQNPTDDGYDGYYKDLSPADGEKQKEGLDVGLIKKIAAVAGAMLVIVTLCVVAMYLL